MEDLAKHPWLFERREKDGTHRFYLRARVPKDLINVFGKREIKKSLGTNDRAEARRLIHTAAARLQMEFDNARRKLDRRPISDLSDSEIRQIALANFWEAQREAIAHDRAGIVTGTLTRA